MNKEEALAATIDAFADATCYALCLALGFILAIVIFSKNKE